MAGAPSAGSSFTGLVGCRLPLQEAVMFGDCGGARLAAAVCRAGGLGMLSESGLRPLGERLDWLDQHCAGPYGVGVLAFSDTVARTIDQAAGRARVVDVFWGLPEPSLVGRIHDVHLLAFWQVGSVEEALAAAGAGCDAVVVQGVEAGGQLRGTTPLGELLDAVVPRVPVPVVAAGGIADAAAVTEALGRGAAAVRVGTRLLATRESNAHPAYIAALLASGADGTEVTTAFGADWPGAPHRVLRSALAAAGGGGGGAGEGGAGPAGRPAVLGHHGPPGGGWDVARWSAFAPTRETSGDVAAMALYAGTGVGRIEDAPPAAEVVARLFGGPGDAPAAGLSPPGAAPR